MDITLKKVSPSLHWTIAPRSKERVLKQISASLKLRRSLGTLCPTHSVAIGLGGMQAPHDAA